MVWWVLSVWLWGSFLIFVLARSLGAGDVGGDDDIGGGGDVGGDDDIGGGGDVDDDVLVMMLF